MDRFKIGLSHISLQVYLDDLVIRSSTFEDHLKDLEQVFRRFHDFQLRINRAKCRFACSTIGFGHVLTPDRITMDPNKIQAIVDLPVPTQVKDLLRFLQICSWYRRFIANFASITKPLKNLTRKNTPWKWGTTEQDAYDKLKICLITDPILKQADESEPSTIKSDASSYAIGAVLVQGEGATEHPIEYPSLLLTSAERNYASTEREALAIVWAISKFRGYIENSETIVITDHRPLKWLLGLKTPTGRLARWALQLQPYNLRVLYYSSRFHISTTMC